MDNNDRFEREIVVLTDEQAEKLWHSAHAIEEIGTVTVQEYNFEGMAVIKESTQKYKIGLRLQGERDSNGETALMDSTVYATTSCQSSCNKPTCTNKGCQPSGNTCTPGDCSGGAFSDCAPFSCVKTTTALLDSAVLAFLAI